MFRNVAGSIVFLAILAGCSDDGSFSATTGVTITQPDPTVPVSGGGVKGPLINAVAALYELDLSAADLKGTLVSSGVTTDTAALQGITIPSGALASFLLEITADNDTVDLTSGAAPIMSRYRTIVSIEDIRSGQVYATPITTLAVELALQSAPFASQADLDEALALSARQVISTLGFGLDPGTNPFTRHALLTDADGTDELQEGVLAYRLAIEGSSAILDLLQKDVLLNDPATTTTVDDVLMAIAEDLSDATIDGRTSAGPINALAGVTDIAAVVSTDPSLLVIPGTRTPISRISDVLVSETATTGVTVATARLTAGTISVTPKRARVNPDIDGDGVSDKDDAFPTDATETVDTDGDGTGNNADTDDDGDGVADSDDAFPLLAEESLDTDGDGTGNNADTDDDNDGVTDDADAFPLDANEITDTDSDGIGNNADTDDDGDGVDDEADAFPLDGSETVDTDGDGIGNNADTDDDGDGVVDSDDNLPLDPQGSLAAIGTIGPDGGTLTSPDGLMTLTFPANAVSTDTVITIGTPTENVFTESDSEEFPLDGLYLLGPDGQQFAEPVTVTWTIPPSSPRPDAVRYVATRSDGVTEFVDDEVTVNPFSGLVSTRINHFSEILFVSGGYTIAINSPGARKGGTLLWEYRLVRDGPDETSLSRRVIQTETEDGTSNPVPVEVISGSEFISDVTHVETLFSETNRDGSISAICVEASEEGLTARIGFNVSFLENDSASFVFFGDGKANLRIEANGTCRELVEITDPTFISIGDQIDRITEAPEGLVPGECSSQTQPYHVVTSNTRVSVINTSGSCSQNLNYPPSSNSVFGALALLFDTVQQLFIYGESGVFITQIIDGVFGELNDFQNVTTDVQHRVNDDGSQVSSEAYSVNNRGQVKLRTILPSGLNTSEDVFSSFTARIATLFGVAPITATTAVGIDSASPSKAYFMDFEAQTATEIGQVGNTALGVSCKRLACDSSASACSVTNTETVGCSVTAFESEEMYSFFASDVITNRTAPTFNFSAPVAGIKTASPYVTSNNQGQLITATVNSNEIGKVRLSIQNPDGTEVQSAEFFLTDYSNVTGFTGTGSSIVMMSPSAEYPNGAVRIGVDNPNGTNDGLLTIPVTEALLGSSPEPFFGPAFTQ